MIGNTDNQRDFTPLNGVLTDVMKEICRRVELRHRLEAEGVVMTDPEFIAYADRTGLKI